MTWTSRSSWLRHPGSAPVIDPATAEHVVLGGRDQRLRSGHTVFRAGFHSRSSELADQMSLDAHLADRVTELEVAHRGQRRDAASRTPRRQEVTEVRNEVAPGWTLAVGAL